MPWPDNVEKDHKESLELRRLGSIWPLPFPSKVTAERNELQACTRQESKPEYRKTLQFKSTLGWPVPLTVQVPHTDTRPRSARSMYRRRNPAFLTRGAMLTGTRCFSQARAGKITEDFSGQRIWKMLRLRIDKNRNQHSF